MREWKDEGRGKGGKRRICGGDDPIRNARRLTGPRCSGDTDWEEDPEDDELEDNEWSLGTTALGRLLRLEDVAFGYDAWPTTMTRVGGGERPVRHRCMASHPRLLSKGKVGTTRSTGSRC